MPEKQVTYHNGKVFKADSRQEAINKWIDAEDERRKILGVYVRDSYTFGEDTIFEQTYYLVSGVNISE